MALYERTAVGTLALLSEQAPATDIEPVHVFPDVAMVQMSAANITTTTNGESRATAQGQGS